MPRGLPAKKSSNGFIAAVWGWAVAFVFAVILSADILNRGTQSPDREEAQCESQYQKADAERNASAAQPKEPSNNSGESDRYYKSREYCVSRRSAIAADRQADYAQFQFVLGFWTLIAAIGAGIAAWRAAAAARDQVGLSRHALIQTERAFVFPRIGHGWGAVKDVTTGNIVAWAYAQTWRNSGKSNYSPLAAP